MEALAAPGAEGVSADDSNSAYQRKCLGWVGVGLELGWVRVRLGLGYAVRGRVCRVCRVWWAGYSGHGMGCNRARGLGAGCDGMGWDGMRWVR